MASLKEVKTRIASVNSTRKITSAMKMVASSKLHHAQQAIEQMRPYESKVNEMMSTFVGTLEGDISSPYALCRPIQRVALIVFSSNSSLCGGFNGNVIKQLRHTIEDYRSQGVEIKHLSYWTKDYRSGSENGISCRHGPLASFRPSSICSNHRVCL